MNEAFFELGETARQVAQMVVLDSVGSTNDYVKTNLAELADFSMVVTDHQTHGRGRQGREWIARAGETLALSFLVPVRSASSVSWLPLVSGASLVHSLHQVGLTLTSLKWPNDVLFGTQKLAGILCEKVAKNRVVVGVGLNVSSPSENPPSAGAISLSNIASEGAAVLDAVVSGFVSTLRQWLVNLEGDIVHRGRELVEPVMATLGKRVRVVEISGGSWQGFAEGLDGDGHLMVRTAVPDEIRTVVASDIEHLRQ